MPTNPITMPTTHRCTAATYHHKKLAVLAIPATHILWNTHTLEKLTGMRVEVKSRLDASFGLK